MAFNTYWGFTKASTSPLHDQYSQTFENYIKNGGSNSSVPCYSRYPEVPDFGAIVGVSYDQFVPSGITGGYYYNSAKVASSAHADDYATLYGEALAKCGFKYSRTSDDFFPTAWFTNGKTSVGFGGKISGMNFYHVIFMFQHLVISIKSHYSMKYFHPHKDTISCVEVHLIGQHIDFVPILC